MHLHGCIMRTCMHNAASLTAALRDDMPMRRKMRGSGAQEARRPKRAFQICQKGIRRSLVSFSWPSRGCTAETTRGLDLRSGDGQRAPRRALPRWPQEGSRRPKRSNQSEGAERSYSVPRSGCCSDATGAIIHPSSPYSLSAPPGPREISREGGGRGG